MNLLWPALVVGGGLALYGAWYKKQGEGVVKEVQVNFKGIPKPPVITLLNTDLTVQIEIYNPALISVDVQSIVGGLYRNGSQLSTFNYSKTFTIASKATTVVDIACKISNLSIATSLFNIITSWAKGGAKPTLNMVIKGDIYVAAIPLSFEYNV